jgi:uncharacterized protein
MDTLQILLWPITVVGLLGFGWLIFSLASGAIIYLTAMTNDHAFLEAKKMTESERNSVLNAHTREQKIMNPINEAKESWQRMRKSGEFVVLSVRSKEGLSLAGYYQPTEAATKTVILVHGMFDTAAGMAYLAKEYLSVGFNVLSIDVRCHGESEGTKRTMGFLEGQDLGAWIRLLISKYGCKEIFLHGVSMGGAASLLYLENVKDLPVEVKGAIIDSCYASYRCILRRLLSLVFRNNFMAGSVTMGVAVACFFNTGIRLSDMSPARALQKISVPLLLFHGQRDSLVPLSLTRVMLNAALQQGSEVIVVPDAPHIGPFFYAKELYMQKVLRFTKSLP